MELKKTFDVLIVGCGIFLMAAQAQADFPVTITSPEALNTNADTDSRHDFAPSVATDGSGKWVAVWQSFEDLDDELGTDADILVSRSTDNGVTWTDPEALNTNADTDSGADIAPQIATDGAGTWITVWSSDEDLEDKAETDKDIFLAVSTDNGATWTDPKLLNRNGGADTGADYEPQIATEDGTTWVAVWTSDNTLSDTIGSDTDILVAVSTNDGALWSIQEALNSDADSDGSSDADARPQIKTDDGTNWVAIWENTGFGSTGSDKDILVSVSTDDGDTWSTSEALNSNATTDSGEDTNSQLATDGAGNWVAVWISTDTLGSTIGFDLDILVAGSTDDGDTWTSVAALNSNAATDSGSDSAPHIATDNDGNWVAIWASTDTLGGTIGTDRDILASVSADDGATWTTVEEFNTNADSDSGNDQAPQVTADGNTNWVGAWHSTDTLGNTVGTDRDIFVARFDICAIPECDDGNDCTEDLCVDNECSNPNEDSGTSCSDGLFCTKQDECDGSGTCVGGDDPCPPSHPFCCEAQSRCFVLPCI